jgi:hypothetical protein
MISAAELRAFKTQFSNENKRIATLLRSQFIEYAEPPILDVGSGLGDISGAAFADREVVLLDRLGMEHGPLPQKHKFIECDFFAFDTALSFQTLLFCHVLQFLDDDLLRLVTKTVELQAPTIIVVENRNDDFMGELVNWGASAIAGVNPEVSVNGFPPNFRLDKQLEFSESVRCETFVQLAHQVRYLLDCDEGALSMIEQYLKDHLEFPSFTINQRIAAYRSCPTT